MFADVVRDAQKQLGINDSTAYDLALQAMRHRVASHCNEG